MIAAHGLPVQVACRVLGVAADAACRPAGHHRTGRWKRIRPDNIATDRVERDFARSGPNQLWVTDIPEHPTREGKVYCCVVLDTYSRVVGWLIDVSPNAALVTHALGMAIEARLGKSAEPGTIIHSDSKTGECQVFPGFVTLTTIGPGVAVVSEVFSQHPDPHSDRPLVVSFLGLVGCSGTPPARPAVSPEPCDSRRA